ncbi:thioredoxin domain-containing protein [Halarchaeum sp. CBA1220]|uniref:thioredoxin domain-containing protein n=1 Tax=Halarchaeum sp. CBA1220 TaxID=1853682 RepID=UPI000F3A9C98|nr:thioredoxin domain-containing protein [Halarchaeum sp. CBA1220]QLC32670.1 thioredoxin domain-containing protein [Halarchaeum sp. CBA1220]
MSDPTDRNRLADEASPYLQQHADNPVNWQPWDDAAFEAAEERDVPVFLSIGYSACHWCHVMAEESFEDPDIADYLNEHFVPVKVDREERPDVDELYMTVAQLATGGGGWPLSVWLTPDKRPFYVGTYFPPESTERQTGFRDVLRSLHQRWEGEREAVEERADQWADALKGEVEAVPTPAEEPPGSDVLDAAAREGVRRADREHGGWGQGQKFPQPGRLHVLLRAAANADGTEHDDAGDPDDGEERPADAARAVATETLDAMAAGGLYDHLGGGFHRYCVDREWTVPHFEKMLYDNAELARVYLAGHQLTGADRYREVAAGALDFLADELAHPEGGFYSTLDARSEGEEGTFYVWTLDEVSDAVDDPADATVFGAYYGVTQSGNFEGSTVLTRRRDLSAVADDLGMSEDEARERLDRAHAEVYDARTERTRPARDEKVIGAWNGLAIRAFAEAGLVLDADYAERAADALGFVRDHLWDDEANRLARRYADGAASGNGYLEDYAFLAAGALTAYEATGDVAHLAFACDLADALVAEFHADGTLYFTPSSGEQLLARPQDLADRSTPSPTGVAVSVLDALAAFRPESEYRAVVDDVLATHADTVENRGFTHPSLVLAAADRERGHLELTVAADDVPDVWRDEVAARYLPDRLLSRRPPTAGGLDGWLDRLGLDEAPPIWAGREARDGPTAYVCRRACSPPVTDTDALTEWLEEYR